VCHYDDTCHIDDICNSDEVYYCDTTTVIYWVLATYDDVLLITEHVCHYDEVCHINDICNVDDMCYYETPAVIYLILVNACHYDDVCHIDDIYVILMRCVIVTLLPWFTLSLSTYAVMTTCVTLFRLCIMSKGYYDAPCPL